MPLDAVANFLLTMMDRTHGIGIAPIGNVALIRQFPGIPRHDVSFDLLSALPNHTVTKEVRWQHCSCSVSVEMGSIPCVLKSLPIRIQIQNQLVEQCAVVSAIAESGNDAVRTFLTFLIFWASSIGIMFLARWSPGAAQIVLLGLFVVAILGLFFPKKSSHEEH